MPADMRMLTPLEMVRMELRELPRDEPWHPRRLFLRRCVDLLERGMDPNLADDRSARKAGAAS